MSGLEGRNTATLAPWLNWTGIGVGITGPVWFVWFLEPPLTLIVLLINVVASLVSFIGVSLDLPGRT